jgi:hypothetical protein
MDELRSTKEIEEMLGRAEDTPENAYPGMTYVQGVQEALRWALGLQDEEPVEKDR